MSEIRNLNFALRSENKSRRNSHNCIKGQSGKNFGGALEYETDFLCSFIFTFGRVVTMRRS